MTLTDIERQGRDAFLAARRRSDCPWAYGPKRKHWLKGWDQTAQTACFS